MTGTASCRNRSKDEKQRLAALLENARYQMKLAKALGYGDKADHEKLLDQIEEIEKKTSDTKAGKGYFDAIKKSLLELKQSIFN